MAEIDKGFKETLVNVLSKLEYTESEEFKKDREEDREENRKKNPNYKGFEKVLFKHTKEDVEDLLTRPYVQTLLSGVNSNLVSEIVAQIANTKFKSYGKVKVDEETGNRIFEEGEEEGRKIMDIKRQIATAKTLEEALTNLITNYIIPSIQPPSVPGIKNGLNIRFGENTMKIVDAGGAGDCLFRSLAHLMLGDRGLHGKLRQESIAHMKKHRDRFVREVSSQRDFLLKQDKSLEKETILGYNEEELFNWYVDEYMSKQGTFGTSVEVKALGERFDRLIIGYSVAGGMVFQAEESSKVPVAIIGEDKIIRLLNRGNYHFQAIQKKKPQKKTWKQFLKENKSETIQSYEEALRQLEKAPEDKLKLQAAPFRARGEFLAEPQDTTYYSSWVQRAHEVLSNTFKGEEKASNNPEVLKKKAEKVFEVAYPKPVPTKNEKDRKEYEALKELQMQCFMADLAGEHTEEGKRLLANSFKDFTKALNNSCTKEPSKNPIKSLIPRFKRKTDRKG